MNPSLQKERTTAIQAVTAASRLCMAVRATLAEDSTMVKRDKSPVTIADFGSQAVICKMLRESFPHDPIVAEEDSQELSKPENRDILRHVVQHVQGFFPEAVPNGIRSWIDWGRQEPSQRFWTLDPIDGTKGFLRGDQYAIALALVEEGQVHLGVLGCPNLPAGEKRGGLFTALRGQGALQSDLEGNHQRPLTVSTTASPADARLTESFESAHSDHATHDRIARRLSMTIPSLRMDSQAKYAILARGEASIYLRLPSPDTPEYRERIWDHAAGTILIEEAGGRATDAFGTPLDFSRGRRLEGNQGIVTTNGLLHEAVLEAVELEIGGAR